MSAKVAIYSPHRHPRLRYALAAAGEELGYTLRIYTDPQRWSAADTPFRLRQKSLVDHPLLAGRTADPGDHPLARVFYHLSRFEEYLPFTPDRHGRFPAAASRREEFGRPVAREAIAEFGRQLSSSLPELPPPLTYDFAFEPTYDIDQLWAYHHRGLRGVASGIRDVVTNHPTRGYARILTPAHQDPFNTLEKLEALHHGHDLRPIYFWLLSERKHRLDINPYPIPPAQREWIKTLAKRYPVGLHPGYESGEDHERLEREHARLGEIIGRKTRRVRLHYLRYRGAQTYRALIRGGFTDDYGMGFADATGWRAGTNRPFYWYDLEREKATHLRLHPFAAMDVTLKNTLELNAEGGVREIMELAKAIAPYGGPFQLLWHNSSFAEAYGWAGWWSAYRELVARLVEIE